MKNSVAACKWHFRNEPSESFSKKPAFFPKSIWKPPEGYPNLEVFLSQIENEIFKTVETLLGYSNLSKEEWEAVRTLADDRNVVNNPLNASVALI